MKVAYKIVMSVPNMKAARKLLEQVTPILDKKAEKVPGGRVLSSEYSAASGTLRSYLAVDTPRPF